MIDKPEKAGTSFSLNFRKIAAGARAVPPATGLEATSLGCAAAGTVIRNALAAATSVDANVFIS